MNTYYVKLLLFNFLINILVLPHNENCEISHYNIILITKNTQKTIIKSRLLAQTQKHNPHYHNDPELKEIIDKLNDEAIKKYQQTHEPYEQLRELVQKNGTKLTGGNGSEHMSTLEKELLETYEEVFGEENHIILKSGMYTNDDKGSNESSSCECTDINNTKLEATKGKDKYLKHLKHRCIGGIGFCSLGCAILTYIGLALAKSAALAHFGASTNLCSTYASLISIFNMFNDVSLLTAIQAGIIASGKECVSATTIALNATGAATTTIFPYSIAIYLLIAIVVILIIIYIWLYRRRKRLWKHECKKHLCK
ncbi:stevor PIR protein, putative [Plasmodium reichenowi]|uniref:Stevor PIR protein, putative n=1 Tax=Plasmodium reichenowi TaxID=5854 RepID=A0A2P9D5V4_PLARE|nr:stevor PIR protein, putative [Plasmodium reichenowi]